jgi:CheY-like chemotaxis protein
MADTKRVLVIDDDPDFCDFVRIVLSANGYQVRTAASTGEGLKLMHAERPDLVIVDMMMSYVLDGWTVSREMHFDPQLRDIPVMMVSAVVSSEEDELLPTGENGRMDAFMSKPLDPSALLRRVADLTREG